MIQIAIFAELCNGVQNPHCISLYINALHCRRTTFKCKNIELFDNQFIVLSASVNSKTPRNPVVRTNAASSSPHWIDMKHLKEESA